MVKGIREELTVQQDGLIEIRSDQFHVGDRVVITVEAQPAEHELTDEEVQARLVAWRDLKASLNLSVDEEKKWIADNEELRHGWRPGGT